MFELLFNQVVTFTATSDNGTSALLELYDYRGIAVGVSGIDKLVFNPGMRAGRYYVSATPVDATFGCSDVAGYTLTADFRSVYQLHLPVMVVDYSVSGQ